MRRRRSGSVVWIDTYKGDRRYRMIFAASSSDRSEKVTYCPWRKERRTSSSFTYRVRRSPLGSWWTKQKMHRLRQRRTRIGSGKIPGGFPSGRNSFSRPAPDASRHARVNRRLEVRKWRSRRSSTGRPDTERIRSPATIPARSAGDPRATDSTPTPIPDEAPPAPSRTGELPDADVHVLQPGDDRRGRADQRDDPVGNGFHSRSQRLRLGGKRRDREKVDDRQHLDRRVRLAEPRRFDVARIEQEEVEEASNEDEDVPADHHDGEAQGDDVDVGEDDEGGRHQQLVGDRVEERADQRPLLQPAGQKAVEHVRRAADGEHHQRQLPPSGDQQEGEVRDQQDARRRQPVGDVDQAGFVEALSCGRWNHSSLSISVSNSGIPSPDFAEIHRAPSCAGAPGRQRSCLFIRRTIGFSRNDNSPRIAFTDATLLSIVSELPSAM